MTIARSSQLWQDIATRLRLAWRVLTGRAVMYRLKVAGTVELAQDCDAAVIACEFRPSSCQVAAWECLAKEGNDAEREFRV